MSDIFISYARADKERAELLAEVFSRQGWSVWWDREISPGKSFDETIETALNSARCVIVLWSKDSVSSRWVKTEAAEGAARGILIPVLIDKAQIPLEFKRIEAADLSD
ncbi:toll/interleukin-1 receptor domain-containing protein [Nitrosomonas sp. Nm132]|uniref:toll/interleukin-1 receptor domain-containing protein n=1 Tax=Nitrosomonas sp. Nm132 TaxID=1881053 RepID=UPI00087E296C|nr:toll/interleukin-1 receptor domain-containing protein [Nitrosomonas sp. Nm132]SDI00835.1 TIR domain-containing protein [Nitrosomonas sp. Nm132]